MADVKSAGGRRYLVTGGLGFVGSHLVDVLLAAGHHVSVLDDLSSGKERNVAGAIDLHVGCVTDRALLTRLMADVDGCFHLAAVASVERSTNDWQGTNAINLGGTVNVFETAANRVPVVYVSSAAVYGEAESLPVSEISRVRPLSAYGADKLACEFHARAGGIVHGLKSFGLRPFNLYGPRQDPSSAYSGVISIFAERAARGDDLRLVGGGHQERDFVYVGDAAQFFIAAMESAGAHAPVANICSGRATRIADLAVRIVALSGSPSKIIEAPPRLGDIQRSQGDPALALSLLGMRADTSLDDGLRILLGCV